MKQLFSLLLIGMLIISTTSFQVRIPTNGQPRNDQTKIEVIFNGKLEFNDLVKIKLDLSQKGIVLDYRMIAFNREGKLKSIDFFVDCRDGFSGSADESDLTYTKGVGFYRDYAEGTTSPFGTFGKP